MERYYSVAIGNRGNVSLERSFAVRQYAQENADYWNNQSAHVATWVVLSHRAWVAFCSFANNGHNGM